MTRTQWIIAAAGGSAALLAGAFLFQALGYAPCKMCLWQRWPHAAAVLIGGLAVIGAAPRWIPWCGALAALVTAGIGGFHAGVEQGWWEGPSSCSGGGNGLAGMTGADLLNTSIGETIIMCDEIAWQFMGLSMAAWNMVFSLIFVVLWIKAARTA